MSRIALANIQALTFYKDSLTTTRRGKPIQQLECIGVPCDLFQPDVVRCVNQGGDGTDVDWKVSCSYRGILVGHPNLTDAAVCPYSVRRIFQKPYV